MGAADGAFLMRGMPYLRSKEKNLSRGCHGGLQEKMQRDVRLRSILTYRTAIGRHFSLPEIT